MPDEVTEQSEPVTTGAEETVVEAPAGVVDITAEPVAGDSAAVAETPVTFDLSSDEGIRAAAEANPTLKGYFDKLQADAANAARQRRDAELRREQGATERARAWQEHIASKYGVQLDPDDQRQAPVFVKANEDYTRAELMKALLNQAAELDDTARGFAEQLEGKPEELTTAAQIVLDAITRRARADERSKAETELEAKYAAKLQAELAALKVEEQVVGRSNAPDVVGSAPAPVGSVTDRLNAMSDSEWQRLVRTNRAEAEALLAQSRAEQARQPVGSR